MPRTLKLDNEHITGCMFTLPSSDWRVAMGVERATRDDAYIAFRVHAEIETDAYRTIGDAVNAAWRLHEQAKPG